ncbi:unnamed protein product [Prorocentrum cordatum]|uniref:Uncharacterized protein n=1 Tax=Prorocentrum cordatum TaxID=2364126 RepID=A0ABN9R296_9DINO|nr:unnamed protein product [Polarella glacialis]
MFTALFLFRSTPRRMTSTTTLAPPPGGEAAAGAELCLGRRGARERRPGRLRAVLENKTNKQKHKNIGGRQAESYRGQQDAFFGGLFSGRTKRGVAEIAADPSRGL